MVRLHRSLQQGACSLNIKMLLLIKENQISQIKEFNIFLCMGSVLPDVRIPEREERRLPRQCNSQKGKFITDSSQGFLQQPMQWCRVRKSLKQRLLPEFIRYA